jgi:hypothetical protein
MGGLTGSTLRPPSEEPLLEGLPYTARPFLKRRELVLNVEGIVNVDKLCRVLNVDTAVNVDNFLQG